MIKIVSASEEITRGVAEKLAREASKTKKLNHALIFALQGNLGAGKTTFIKGFIRGLGYKKRITSPTFLIFKRFDVKNKGFKNVYHVDAYRIKRGSELDVLGFKEVLSSSQNIVLVEWADKIKKVLPERTIWIKFDYGKYENERKIIIHK